MDILNREKQYRGHIVDLEKVYVRLPDGKERAYELVNHAPAVTVLPIDAEGNIYFVEQYRLGAEQTLLELPAGVIDPGEAPDQAAQRELREETGFACQTLSKLGSFYMIAGYGDEFMHVYLAQDLYPAPLTPDADEDLKLTLIPITKAYKMLYADGFKDAKTIALLSLAIPKLLANYTALHQSFKE